MEFKENKSFGVHIDPHILQLREFNEIKALVETAFKEYELRFSLLELGLLNEGIGETFIYGNNMDEDLSLKYESYIDLVNKFKNNPTFEGGISSYKEWYTRGIWYRMGGEGQEGGYYNTYRNGWLRKYDPKLTAEYGKKQGLTEDFIKQYLNKYWEEIIKQELGQYPFYCVMITPLGYWHSEKREMVPLGNLYLHFATGQQFSEEFLLKFLRDFLFIWHKNYAGVLVKKVKDEALAEIENTKPKLDYLFEMPKDTEPAKRLKIEQLLVEAYTNCLEKLEEQDKILKEQFLPFLLTQRGIENRTVPQGKTWGAFEKYYKGKIYTEQKHGINRFCEVLAVRRAVFLMHILFDYSLIEIHAFLRSGDISEKHTGDGGTIYSYLLARFIPGLTRAIEPNTRRKIEMYQFASEKERTFLKECLDIIHQSIPEEQRGKYSLPAEI